MANFLRDAVNKAVNVYEFIKEHDLTHKVNGDEIFIVCPFHNDKNPSCSVSTSKKIFHCFGCQINGDIVFLMAKILRKSTDEVISLACLKYGIKYPASLEEVTKKEEPDQFLEEIVVKRDIHFLRWILITTFLHRAHRLYRKAGVFSDEAVFYYKLEAYADAALNNLTIADEGLRLYCLTKGIPFPKASVGDDYCIIDNFVSCRNIEKAPPGPV